MYMHVYMYMYMATTRYFFLIYMYMYMYYTFYLYMFMFAKKDCLLVMLKYLNELSFYYLAAGTQENAQVISRTCMCTHKHTHTGCNCICTCTVMYIVHTVGMAACIEAVYPQDS